MMNPIKLINDLFDDKDFSDAKLQAFTDSHLIRLANLNPGSIYSTIITDTSNKYTAYYGKLVSEATKIAVREGLTQSRNEARETMLEKVSSIGDLASYKFKNNQAVYQQFFPQGVDEYYQANLSEINQILDRLVTAATAHLTADFPAEVTDLTNVVNAFKAARQAQLNAFSLEVNEQTDRRLARKDLTLQLTTNFLTIAINNLEQPDAYNNYYDEQLLPLRTSDDDENNVTVSGILTSNATGLPIAGAQFVMGPHTFTSGADGSFSKSFFIDAPTTYNITITAAGFETVNSTVQFTPNVNVEQDLQMTPNTMVGSLSGTVSDAGTAMGINGAAINISGPGVAIATNADANGNYNVGGIPAGTYTVTANAPGYLGQSVSATINANSNTIQNFSLVVMP